MSVPCSRVWPESIRLKPCSPPVPSNPPPNNHTSTGSTGEIRKLGQDGRGKNNDLFIAVATSSSLSSSVNISMLVCEVEEKAVAMARKAVLNDKLFFLKVCSDTHLDGVTVSQPSSLSSSFSISLTLTRCFCPCYILSSFPLQRSFWLFLHLASHSSQDISPSQSSVFSIAIFCFSSVFRPPLLSIILFIFSLNYPLTTSFTNLHICFLCLYLPSLFSLLFCSWVYS